MPIPTIFNVLEALQNVVNAQHEHNKQRDAGNGYSWDWHGRYVIEEMERAQEVFRDVFEAYIDARIETALSNKKKE